MKNCPWKKAKEDECGHSFHLAIVSISITIFFNQGFLALFPQQQKVSLWEDKKKNLIFDNNSSYFQNKSLFSQISLSESRKTASVPVCAELPSCSGITTTISSWKKVVISEEGIQRTNWSFCSNCKQNSSCWTQKIPHEFIKKKKQFA